MTERRWIVPTRVIETAMEATLAIVDQAIAGGEVDPLLERVFSNYSADERSRVKSFFAQSATKSAPIIRNFPRMEQQFPCYSILILGEQHSQHYVGDAAGEFIDPDTGDTYEVEGERWTGATGCRVYAEHPDHVEWLYQLAKWGLARQRRANADLGFAYIQKVGGKDLGFAKEFIEGAGRFVYVRELVLSAEYDQLDVDPDTLGDAITGHETAPTEVIHG